MTRFSRMMIAAYLWVHVLFMRGLEAAVTDVMLKFPQSTHTNPKI
jgi:hypothetical protein